MFEKSNMVSKKRWQKFFVSSLIFVLSISAIVTLFNIQSAKAVSRTWDGGGGDNNWSTAANWSDDTVPGDADIAVFDDTSTKDATIDASFGGTVDGIDINTGYTGTITVARSFSVETGDYNQADGTFDCGSQTIYFADADFVKTGGTFTEGTSSAIFSGANTTIDVATTETFYDVTINKSLNIYNLTISSGDTIVVANDLTLTQARLYTGTLDVRGNITQAATFNGGDATIGFGDNSVVQTYTIAGGKAPIIEFDHASDANDSVVFSTTDVTLYGLNITVDFGANAVPFTYNSHNLTIEAGGFTQAAGTFTAPSVMTLSAAGFTKTGGTFAAGTGSVVFSGANSTIDVATTETFYDVTVNKSLNIYDLTISSGDTMVVANDFTLTTGRLYTGIVSAQGNVTITSGIGTNTSPLHFTGGNTQTFDLTGAEALFNSDIHVNKSGGQVNLASNLTMDANSQDFIIEEGTFDLAGYDLSVTGGATETLIVEDGGNLQLQGDETITGDSASYPQLDTGSTVTYDGTGSYTIKDYTYSNLATNGSGTYSMGVAEAIDSLNIIAGTFDVTTSNYGLTVGDDFSNAGTFTARAGAVTFDDVSNTSVVSGSTSFYNLACTTASKRIDFTAASITTVTNLLTLTGTSENLIDLNSATPDTRWNLTASGTHSVDYVDVKDSDASGGDAILQTNSTDSGNNVNWIFNAVPTAASVTASQVTDGSGNVNISFIADDADDDDTLEALVEYDIGGGWQKATISEVGGDITATYGTPDVENDDTYQVGNAGGYITTSSGANTITVVWNASTDEAAADVADAQIRVTPYDGTAAGTAVESSAFELDVVVPTFSSATYVDTNADGTVDRVDVVFNDDMVVSYNTADWSLPASDTMNLDDTGATASTSTIQVAVSADSQETGSSTSPTILYTNNAGRITDDQGNPLATFGSAQTVTDAADPRIISVSPTHGADATPSDDVVVTFTEAINTATDAYTFSNGPTGQSTAWTMGDTVLTISHTGDFALGSQTFTMTVATDSASNTFAGPITGVTHPVIFTVVNTVPTAASVSGSQVTDGSGEVTVQFTLDDADNDDTLEALVEYDIGGGWTKATISEDVADTSATYGTPDVENDDTYQVGNAGGYITSSSGANTITVVWNASTDEAAADVSDAQIRVTPYDGTGAGTAVESSAFDLDVVAPIFSSATYLDVNADGTVDRVDVVFSETITLSSYDASDWSFSASDTMNLDDSGAYASSSTVQVSVSADAQETGSSVAPTILYTNNAGRLVDASGNPVATFGSAQAVTDDADPYIVSISPAHEESNVQTNADVVVTFTEPINTAIDAYTFSDGPTGQSTAWTVGDTVLTISHTGAFATGDQTFTMTVASDSTGNTLGGAIAGVTHPVTFSVSPPTSSTSNIDYVSNNSVEINNGDECSANNTVTVRLKASLANQYILSDSEDFLGVTWEPFVVDDDPESTSYGSNGKAIYTMTLSYILDETSGDHTIYAKFKSNSGNLSSVTSDIVELDLEDSCTDLVLDPDDSDDTTSPDGSDDGEVAPEIGDTELISEILPSHFVKGMNFQEVYWISDDLKRHVLFNPFTFYTYETTREVIRLVTDATLAQLEFGDTMGPKPGSVLIKFQSTPEVYFIEENLVDEFKPILRHIINEDIAEEIIGDDWKEYIFEIEPTFFPRFEIGEPVEEAGEYDASSLITMFEFNGIIERGE